MTGFWFWRETELQNQAVMRSFWHGKEYTTISGIKALAKKQIDFSDVMC